MHCLNPDRLALLLFENKGSHNKNPFLCHTRHLATCIENFPQKKPYTSLSENSDYKFRKFLRQGIPVRRAGLSQASSIFPAHPVWKYRENPLRNRQRKSPRQKESTRFTFSWFQYFGKIFVIDILEERNVAIPMLPKGIFVLHKIKPVLHIFNFAFNKELFVAIQESSFPLRYGQHQSLPRTARNAQSNLRNSFSP